MTGTVDQTVCLSIIIPVYNVEAYLGKCIDSFLKTEGIADTEMIIVDDGSTDSSDSIADSYAGRYDFIKCFHKSNGGLSDARNYGLAKASGKYVFFCDSDDFIIPEGMNKVIEFTRTCDADVILWDGIAVDENDEKIESELHLILVHNGLVTDGSTMTGTEVMTGQIKDHNKIAMTAWLRACRREFLIQNEMLFEKGLIHEDELWTPKVLTSASSAAYLPCKLYCYRVRKNSIMDSGDDGKHAKAMTYILNSVYDIYAGKVSDKKTLNVLLANWADTYLWAIAAYGFGNYECRKEVPAGKIFKSCRSFKSRLKGLLLLLTGVKGYCRVARR